MLSGAITMCARLAQAAVRAVRVQMPPVLERILERHDGKAAAFQHAAGHLVAPSAHVGHATGGGCLRVNVELSLLRAHVCVARWLRRGSVQPAKVGPRAAACRPVAAGLPIAYSSRRVGGMLGAAEHSALQCCGGPSTQTTWASLYSLAAVTGAAGSCL